MSFWWIGVRRSVTWSADGRGRVSRVQYTRRPLSSSDKRPIAATLWDLQSGEPAIVPHPSLARRCQTTSTAVAWSPKQSCFVTAHYDVAVSIWESQTQRMLASILKLGHDDDSALALAPDGNYVLTGSTQDAIVHVALTDAGQQITLTPEEFAKKYGWKNDPSKVWPLASTRVTPQRPGASLP